MTTGFFNRKYWFGSIFGVEERQVELLMWLDLGMLDKGPKVSNFFYTFMLCYSSGSFLGCFPVPANFSDKVPRHGLIEGCSSYNLNI